MGSEMCIRDRVSGTQRFDGASQVNVSYTWAKNLTDAQNDRSTSCLLYTSDAADERSSVDLGGRRIIKKNKIATPYSSRIA